MSSLIDMITSQIGGEVVKQIGSSLGIDASLAEQAIKVAAPMIVGQLGKNAASESGAAALNGALEKDHDGSILDNLAGVLTNPSTLSTGSAILGHVFGNKQTGVNQALGQTTGLEANQAGKIFEMLAPVVMGALGQQKRKNDWNPSDLSNMLGNQKQEAESKLGGLAKLIDMDNDGDISDDLMNLGSQLLGGLFKK